MAPKMDSTKKQTPMKLANRSNRSLMNEDTDESSVTVEEYPLEGQVTIRKKLPREDKDAIA